MTDKQEKIYETIQEIMKNSSPGLHTLVVHHNNYEDCKIAARRYNHDKKRSGSKIRITVKAVKP